MNGEMSLTELQMLIAGYNKNMKEQSGDKSPEYNGPSKWSDDEWENNEVAVAEVIAAAEKNKE